MIAPAYVGTFLFGFFFSRGALIYSYHNHCISNLGSVWIGNSGWKVVLSLFLVITKRERNSKIID